MNLTLGKAISNLYFLEFEALLYPETLSRNHNLKQVVFQSLIQDI